MGKTKKPEGIQFPTSEEAGLDTAATKPNAESTPLNPGKPNLVNLDQAVSDSVSSATAPSESAISAHQVREEGKRTEESGLENGKKVRGPYKKRGTGGTERSTLRTVTDTQIKEGYRAVGRQIADTLIIAGQTFGGKDWEPKTVTSEKGEVLFDERHNLREAWADMAEEYKWEKFPGWLGATLATAAYIGPRLNAPSTVSRWEKVKLWWQARKMKQLDERTRREKEAEARTKEKQAA